MGSGAMIIPSFMKIGSGIQKLIRGIYRQHGHRISIFFLLFLFSKKLK
jgi:hypothetical protein